MDAFASVMGVRPVMSIPEMEPPLWNGNEIAKRGLVKKHSH